MSYQLYVAGGYGFTERILPSLIHPSDAVSIAQDYFSRGYQGAHIEPPPDGGYRALERSSSSERQAILDALQSGQLVLGRLDSAAFGIFSKRTASPEHLRSDLPASLASRLRDRWPTGGSAGPAAGTRPSTISMKTRGGSDGCERLGSRHLTSAGKT